jgi:hypothetical protein
MSDSDDLPQTNSPVLETPTAQKIIFKKKRAPQTRTVSITSQRSFDSLRSDSVESFMGNNEGRNQNDVESSGDGARNSESAGTVSKPRSSFTLQGLLGNIKQQSVYFGSRNSGVEQRSSSVGPSSLKKEEERELTPEEENDAFLLQTYTHSRNPTVNVQSSIQTAASWFSELQAGFQSAKNRVTGELPPSETGDYDWDFWGRVINDYDTVIRSQPRQFQNNLHRGLPPPIRGMMWQLMSNSKSETLEAEYLELLERSSRHEKIIRRDLNRTFPDHAVFQDPEGPGQTSLFNVLKGVQLLYSLFYLR